MTVGCNGFDVAADGGMVFGVPLGQCVENERVARSGKVVDPLRGEVDSEDTELRRKSHHGSRSSFTSLIDPSSSGEQVRL